MWSLIASGLCKQIVFIYTGTGLDTYIIHVQPLFLTVYRHMNKQVYEHIYPTLMGARHCGL